MKISQLILCTIALCGAERAWAQGGINTYDLADLAQLNAAGSYRQISFQELNKSGQVINGLPVADWQPGVIRFRDGRTSSTLRLRYDAGADIVWATALPVGPQDYYRAPDQEKPYYATEISGFLLAQASAPQTGHERAAVHFRSLPLDVHASASAFFDELTPASLTGPQLLARYTVQLETGGTYVPALNVGSRTLSERLKVAYFLAWPGHLPQAIRLTRKQVLASLPEQAAEVDKYAKKQQVSFTTPEGVAQLVSYYNSLTQAR